MIAGIILMGIGVAMNIAANSVWTLKDAMDHGFDKGWSTSYIGSDEYNRMERKKRLYSRLFFGGTAVLVLGIILLWL
jgi:hypothetical protein